MLLQACAFLLLTLSTTVCAYPGVHSSKISSLMYNWAPLVRIAKNELWHPSGVDYFLAHTNLIGCGTQPNPSVLTIYNLEKCNGDSYLTTKESITCPSCTEPVVLRGQHPSVVPVYVIYREHNNFLEVAYWIFFPYNRGKRVCVGYFQRGCLCPEVWGVCPCGIGDIGCIGGYSTFGHHVGDWEKVIVRFRKVGNDDYQIYSIYLSIHGSEVTNKFGGEFLWQDGQFKKGSQTLAMHAGTHAIVYCAEGSHGMWPTPGRHVYQDLPNGETLVDVASFGLNWYIWERLKPVQFNINGQYSGEFTFLRFQGRWGNRKEGCDIIEWAADECQLNDGPTGPNGFPNY